MEVNKSSRDKKEYRAIYLENGVAAVLISDTRMPLQTSSLTSLCDGNTSEGDGSDENDTDEDDESENNSSQEEDETDRGGDHITGIESVCGSNSRRKNVEKSNNVQSACGVCIRTGSFCDPLEIPGLAHLLEHMVFMGSEKYRGENTFDAFTNKHGGIDNASTDYERTVYQFCINPQNFRKGLDMFAHFFASPLLLKQSLDREIEAVDNEFQMAIQKDSDRIERMIASLASPTHPLSNFVWGNSESLRKTPRKKRINVAKRLREYYQRNYSSHYMTVAVMSCYPLDTLEQWVRESFTAVPHNGLSCPSFVENKDAFQDSTFCKLYKIVPVKDVHKIRLMWALPSLYDKYRSKPMCYLSWLLGHEGDGSVFAYLKKRNLATSLCAGNGGAGYEYNSSFSLFFCSITLTDKGFKEALQCVTLVFQYLKLLTCVGPQERIFREIQEIEKNDFEFKEEEEPVDFVERVCEMMAMYPVEHYLTGDYLLFDYDPNSISSILNLLTPDRVNIMWLSRRFADGCDLKEKWFKTEYSKEDIPLMWRKVWQNLNPHPDLELPKPNLFIATDFSLQAPDLPSTKYPVVIDECAKYKVWYKKEALSDCSLPRGWVGILFRTPLHFQSPQNAILMHLFLYLYGLNISEVAYAASVAQLNHSVNIAYEGIAIILEGFNHKIPLLFEELVYRLARFETAGLEETFMTAKEELRKSYSNRILKPMKLCKMGRLKILEHCNWNERDKLKVIDTITLSSLQEFMCQFRNQMYVEALVQGNITSEEVQGMMAYLIQQFQYQPLPREFFLQPRAMQLPSNTAVQYHMDNRDTQSPTTVIIDYYQCCRKTIRDQVIAELLSVCMEEPSFNELRTKQQLGYSVHMTSHNTHGVVGMSLTLVTQGTKHSAEFAGHCMDEFVWQFHNTLLSWSADQFQNQMDALIQEKRQPDLSLSDEVDRNWSEVMSTGYQFNRLELEAQELLSVTQEEVCGWLHRFTHSGGDYRKLSVKVVSVCTLVKRGSSDEINTRASKPTPDKEPSHPSLSVCLKCVSSQNNSPLLPGESSVDPPQHCYKSYRPAQLLVCEQEKAATTDGCDVVNLDSFRRSLFVCPYHS